MEIDKRPVHVWIVAALLSITAVAGTLLNLFSNSRKSFSETFGSLTGDLGWPMIIVGLYLFLSFIPALIANSKLQKRIWLGFGIPVLVIIPSAIHSFTCSGKFCNFIDIPIIFSSLVFALLYGFYRLILRWNVKFSRSIVCIEVLAICFSIVSIFMLYYSDTKMEKTFAGGTVGDQSAVSICENIKEYDKSVNCWSQLVKIRQPVTNICTLASTGGYYSSCFDGIMQTYRDYNSGINNKNLAKVCKNIAEQTMEKYNIQSTDEFILMGSNNSSNFGLVNAMQIIRACDYNMQPYKDLELISRAYNNKYAPFCNDVESLELKNKCLLHFNQAGN